MRFRFVLPFAVVVFGLFSSSDIVGGSDMGPAPVSFLDRKPLAMYLLVSVHLIILFHLIDASLFPPFVSFFRCVLHSLSLPCLLAWVVFRCLYDCLPRLRRLPRRIFFPPNAYFVVVSFVSSPFFAFVCVSSWQQCPLLATFMTVSFCLLSLFFFPTAFPVRFGLVPPIL